ncbi:hypothetical protein [Rhizobacter sp. SG703]|uniref:hypothetical protein n=1 Tax=Rhizobacter sp. SG703 TaxID=2587140 RepID=UPI00144827A7|nr:hypothetical protein [Rhizobacter sp. SG703]NKI96642.1 hypothetical protein [Rhizobacter sp. SG703]
MTGHLLDQINIFDYETRNAREEFFRGFGALDAKRPNAWKQYGYPDTVTFDQLLTAYQRGGPRSRASRCTESTRLTGRPERFTAANGDHYTLPTGSDT